jgi:hypothetical protein
VGRQTCTGGRILTVIANNKSADVKPDDIVARRVEESAQNLIQKLRGRGRKLAAQKWRGKPKKKKKKKVKLTKRKIFS